jgi:hypothetical protein
MELITFPEQNATIAKHQPEFRPIPAHINPVGVVTFCWKLSPDELERVLVTGCIWHQVHTGGVGLQPVLLSAIKPKL